MMDGARRSGFFNRANVVLAAVVIVSLHARIAWGQDSFVSGQIVGGGGRSATATQSIVGNVVAGSGGSSAGGGFRISGGAIHLQAPLAATYTGAAVQIVDAVNRTLKIAVEGGTGGITGRFFSRMGGEQNYTQVAMTAGTGDTMIHVLAAARLTMRGLEYYFGVERGGGSVQVGSPNEPFAFITRLQNVAAPVSTAGQYRMIGFPFDVSPSLGSSVFEDDLGAYDPTAWRLGRFNPQTESYDEYPAVGPIERGRGYWLITRDAKTVDASGQSAVPDTTVTDVDPDVRYATLVIAPGWNQISTPFAFDILWSERRAENGIESVLWGYTSGFNAVTSYSPVQRLRAFEGYWLFNSGASPRQLLLPYVEAPDVGMAGTPANDDTWRINFAVTSDRAGDMTNVAGVMENALTGEDDFDFSEPPAIGDYVSLAFVQTQSPDRRKLLAGDMRGSGDSLYIFDCILRGNTSAPVELETTFEGQLRADRRVILLDVASGRVYDLRATPDIVIANSLTESGAEYKLYVGDHDNPAIPDPTTLILPRSFALEQNYPNPFNAGTTIRIDIATAGRVKVTVFDVLGRTVKVLVDRNYAPGRYDVTWDGRDDYGRGAASGIYFYRFESAGIILTKKMTLLK